MGLRAIALVILALVATEAADAQPPARRLSTVHALRQFPGYYHLQTVVLRGEFVEEVGRITLRADDQDIRVVLADGVRTTGGSVEVRGQLIDVGRLEPGDPRVAPAVDARDGDRWPRPGEELFVRVTDVAEAQPVIDLGVRDLALEPWRYQGQAVTVTGNFRGRNLFGDLPGAPGTSRYEFVLRGAEGAIWVTGQRPRGRGFDLDVDRRLDTDRWLQVTGVVVHERGMVRIDATQLAAATAPAITTAADEPAAPPPPPPAVEVVFSTPTSGEIDVSGTAPVRIQFSKGLDPTTVPGAVRVAYVGGSTPPPAFEASYDGASRALTLRFEEPLAPFSTVRVEVLDGLRAFDGGTATPWTLTFTVGG